MKNFPRKLDSKTTNLRITVPENLDLALEGLIRKVLREQPKTDDIYSFAADYFETLLKIRDKAGAKYMSSQICSFHNDEDAHEMIKMANSFPKPRTASDEGKNEQDSGKAVPSGKSLVTKEPVKVSKGSRITGDKRKPPVERIKPTTNTKSKTVPPLVKPIAEAVTKPIPQEPKVKDEKEDKLVTEPESNLQDIGEDEEFLKSDPIKELVERELMSKTTQNDVNRDKGQSSADMTENEKVESEKGVDKVSKVIEPHGNDKLKDELESKDDRKDEVPEEEPTAIGDELCGVVDVLSIPRAQESENETTTIQKEENKDEINLNKSDEEKTEEGGRAIETPKPATEETVKEIDKSTAIEKLELVTDGKVEDLKEEKPDDGIVKQEEDIEKKEIKDEGEKPNESTDNIQEGKEQIKEIEDKLDDTEDIKDRFKEDAEENKDKPKEDAIDKLENDTEDNKSKFKEDAENNEDKPKESTEEIDDKLKDAEDIKDKSKESTENNTDKTNEGADDIKDKPEDDAKDIKKELKESAEDNKDKPKEDEEDIKEKPKDAEDNKETSIKKEETDIITNKKEEEISSEKPNIEVKETDDTIKTTQEAEKDTGDISQANISAIPDDSKVESANETEEKQKEETENQTSLPEENSPQEETTKEEISNEEPLTDSKKPVEKEEDEEIKTQLETDKLQQTTETDNTPDNKQIIENKSEKNDEIKVETKELVEEELQKTEEISISLDERNKTTETDTEKPNAVNETHTPDKEDVNQNSENAEESHIKDVAIEENLKETKEEVIEKEEIKPQSESIIKKEEEEEAGKSKPEGETGIISTEDEKKTDETEKPTSETDQQDDKPEKPKIIVSTEEEPVGEENEDKGNAEIEVEKVKPEEEKPEPIDQEKTESKPEEVRMETEQLSKPEGEITETGIELKENNNEESEESKQSKTEEEPEKELSPGSEVKAEGETLGEKAVPEVEVETTEGEFKPDEVKETEKMSTQVDTTVNEESVAVATPDKDDKDLVKDEEQKTPNDEYESKTKTEETQQMEETENLKGEEEIPPRQDSSKEPKENETTDDKTENKTQEIVEENKPEDITNQDIEPNKEKTETETKETAEEIQLEDTIKKDIELNEEKTETHEPISEATAESELSTVVDTQNLTKPETARPEDGKTIKTITTHYYDLLQVPTIVTKEFKVHHSQDTPHDLSNVGNTIIKSYQLVKELTSDGDNNNNQQTVSQDISPGIDSTNQTQETEIEPGIQKDEIEGLNAIPTSGELYTMHELFLDSERKLSSYQKEGPKLSSLKTAKESLEDTKIQTESPKTPPANDNNQEVEEIITKTIIPRIPEAVPVPPREVEEINAETNTEQTSNVKDTKEDDKPNTNSSEDSNELTDSSNNGRSIDSDVPIISVEVRTVIETQILDDDDEAIEDTQKRSDYRTELTLTDSSNDVNVEVEATIEVPLETTDSEKGHNQNLTDQEKTRQQQETKQQTNNQEQPLEKPVIKASNDDSEPRGSSTVRDGSSGESDSTTLTAATEIKRFDSARKNFARSSTQDLLTSQSLDSGKRPPLLKTRSLSVFRQGVTDFEIWNTIEKELEEAATKIQSKYRGYTVRKRLRREDAVQITTEESSVSTTPGEQEPHLDGDDLRTTGEFHDSIVLSIHPR